MKLNKLNLAVATIIAASSFVYTGAASADASTSPIMVADAGSSAPTQCTTRKQFTLAVSIYTGWMPWYLADQDGVLKKWGDKYCMDITVQKMGYGPSISDGYLAGNAQALVVTNIDLMTALGSSNKDTTVIVMGDFSNGNDKVLGRGVKDLNGVVGKSVYLVRNTVSQYVLNRCLGAVNKSQSDVKMVDTPDTEIQQNFLADKKQEVVVTWNPMAMTLAASKGVKELCSSSAMPGEVQDLLVVDTKTLAANPDLGRVLTGAWYEEMSVMSQRGAVAQAANAEMARLSEVKPVEFNGQLKTTAMFYTAESAVAFTTSQELKDRNETVRKLVFDNGMMDEKITSADFIGIQYPDGTVHGDANNVLIRYDATFMTEAKDGKLSK